MWRIKFKGINGWHQQIRMANFLMRVGSSNHLWGTPCWINDSASQRIAFWLTN
jgi:hypothetical protein